MNSKEALYFLFRGTSNNTEDYTEEYKIVEKDLEMLEKYKDLLLELVSDRLASTNFTIFACGRSSGKSMMQERVAKLIKLKEWLEDGKSEK